MIAEGDFCAQKYLLLLLYYTNKCIGTEDCRIPGQVIEIYQYNYEQKVRISVDIRELLALLVVSLD